MRQNRHWGRRLAALALTAALTGSAAPALAAGDYWDVDRLDWYYDRWIDNGAEAWYREATAYALDNSLILPFGRSFEGGEVLNRGQFVAILSRLEGIDRDAVEQTGQFTDVTAADYFAPAVYWASASGVVEGASATTFHPEGTITREQVATLLARYLEEKGEAAGVHPIYRLDRNTTGLVLVEKSSKVQHDLSKSHDRIYREYVALASGVFPEKEGMVDAPIGRKDGSIIEWTVREDGKPARTDYQVMKQLDDFALLRLHLHTGRTHQIRVHMAYIHHPLLGDDLYGTADARIDRQALHAEMIRFVHPETGKEMEFHAPIPAHMLFWKRDKA